MGGNERGGLPLFWALCRRQNCSKSYRKIGGGVKLRILHMLSYIAFCSSVVASVHRYVTEGNVATDLTNTLLFEFPQSEDVSARYARSSAKLGVRMATIQNFFSNKVFGVYCGVPGVNFSAFPCLYRENSLLRPRQCVSFTIWGRACFAHILTLCIHIIAIYVVFRRERASTMVALCFFHDFASREALHHRLGFRNRNWAILAMIKGKYIRKGTLT